MSEATKVVFMDCDGVVSPLSGSLFSKPHMERLKKILDHSGASLVLSCPWRKAPYGLGMIAEHLAANNIATFIDITPTLENQSRAAEILSWLGANKDKRNIVNFVALSDTPLTDGAPHPAFFMQHAVRTRSIKGLSDEDVEHALELLSDSNNLTEELNVRL